MKTNYWQDAPERARWIAWDTDGDAWWYAGTPVWRRTEFVTNARWAKRCPQHDDTNKAGQLEKRPKGEL